MTEVTFCPFEQLFDQELTDVLIRIFELLDPADFDAAIRVCHGWRAFIGRHLVCNPKTKHEMKRRKLPYEWMHKEPSVSTMEISKTLAPPLRIYSDRKEILMTTVDSILVWNRKTKSFRGEFGPEIRGANHVMIKTLSFNSHFMVTAHNHTTLLLVWNRGNFKVIQEVPCMGIEGSEVHPLFVKVLDRSVVAWLEDGSIVVFAMARDGTLKRQRTLNGHIQGNTDAALCGNEMLTASADSKVNLWDIEKGKLKWSNSRSEARYRKAKLSKTKAVVGGSYDQDGYLQIYDRKTGDVLHEMVSMEGKAVKDIKVTDDKVIAMISIRHKLLTSKIVVLDASNGDLVTEQTFVDVLDLSLVCERLLVVLNNQVGDFRTRISVYDLETPNNNVFGTNRVVYQYGHSYWKLPIKVDDASIIHTSEEKCELFVRDFDRFFTQFDKRDLSYIDRKRMNQSSFCFRLRRILLRKLCDKCNVM